MEGAAGRQLTARWLLDSDGRCGGSSTAIDRVRDSAIATAMVMDCDHNGDGQQWTAMDGVMTT